MRGQVQSVHNQSDQDLSCTSDEDAGRRLATTAESFGHLVDSHDYKQLGFGIWVDNHDPRALQLTGVEHESALHYVGLGPVAFPA